MSLKTNIISVIQNEGIQLKRSGKAYKAHCPFHEDRTPSFFVYPETNSFYCFGCHHGGDAIAFIMRLKNLTFKEALSHLDTGHQTVKRYQNKDRRNRKRQLIKSFREWCNHYYDEVSTEYRCINKVMRIFKSMDEYEKYASLYHRLPVLEYHMDVIVNGNDEERVNLYREIEK